MCRPCPCRDGASCSAGMSGVSLYAGDAAADNHTVVSVTQGEGRSKMEVLLKYADACEGLVVCKGGVTRFILAYGRSNALGGHAYGASECANLAIVPGAPSAAHTWRRRRWGTAGPLCSPQPYGRAPWRKPTRQALWFWGARAMMHRAEGGADSAPLAPHLLATSPLSPRQAKKHGWRRRPASPPCTLRMRRS